MLDADFYKLKALVTEVDAPDVTRETWARTWSEAKPLIEKTGRFREISIWSQIGGDRGFLPSGAKLP